MKHTTLSKLYTLLFVFLLAFSLNSFAQVDSVKLKTLKAKYKPWGNIYVTYVGLLNLKAVLEDDKKRMSLTQTHGNSTMSLINTFIQNTKLLYINQSIAFVQLDLNRLEAGYKLANDTGGQIMPIAWTSEQVVAVADLLDKQMTSISTMTAVLKTYKESSLKITDAYAMLQGIDNNPYISPEAFYLVSKEFNLLLLKKDDALTELKYNNAKTYSAIAQFKMDYNDSYTKFQAWGVDTLKGQLKAEYNFGSPKTAWTLDQLISGGKPKDLDIIIMKPPQIEN